MVAPGQSVVSQGARGNRAVFALRGTGKAQSDGHALWDFTEGNCEGEACVLGIAQTYLITIEAKTLLHVVYFSRATISEAVTKNTHWRAIYSHHASILVKKERQRRDKIRAVQKQRIYEDTVRARYE